MKKEISPLIVVVAVLVLIVGGWFVFQKTTGPIRSEAASPDVTKMTPDEIAKIKQNSNPENLR